VVGGELSSLSRPKSLKSDDWRPEPCADDDPTNGTGGSGGMAGAGGFVPTSSCGYDDACTISVSGDCEDDCASICGSVGVSGRFEYPILKYLTTGGGLSVWSAKADVPRSKRKMAFGFYPGMIMWVTSKVGVMFELGWSRSGWKYKAGGLEAGSALDQAAINLGVTIAL